MTPFCVCALSQMPESGQDTKNDQVNFSDDFDRGKHRGIFFQGMDYPNKKIFIIPLRGNVLNIK